MRRGVQLEDKAVKRYQTMQSFKTCDTARRKSRTKERTKKNRSGRKRRTRSCRTPSIVSISRHETDSFLPTITSWLSKSHSAQGQRNCRLKRKKKKQKSGKGKGKEVQASKPKSNKGRDLLKCISKIKNGSKKSQKKQKAKKVSIKDAPARRSLRRAKPKIVHRFIDRSKYTLAGQTRDRIGNMFKLPQRVRAYRASRHYTIPRVGGQNVQNAQNLQNVHQNVQNVQNVQNAEVAKAASSKTSNESESEIEITNIVFAPGGPSSNCSCYDCRKGGCGASCCDEAQAAAWMSYLAPICNATVCNAMMAGRSKPPPLRPPRPPENPAMGQLKQHVLASLAKELVLDKCVGNQFLMNAARNRLGKIIFNDMLGKNCKPGDFRRRRY